MKRLTLFYVALLPLFAQSTFREHVIATGLSGGYQVVVADMNHDGKPDLIALASGLTELAWFENPGWQRHVIIGGLKAPINLAVVGTDSRGIPILALAHDFSNQAKRSIGTVSILEKSGDDNTWKRTDIDRLPSSHRLRFVNGLLINAPLTNETTDPPDYRGNTPLVYYRPGEWKRRLIDDADEGVVHGIYPVDWDGDGRSAILTASFKGIHLLRQSKDGSWTRTLLTPASPEAWPKSGASDVAVGKLGKARFLASIEPWHGNEVVVYTGENWKREVIDSTLVYGHVLLTGDLDGNGKDAIIAAYRGKGASVNLYRHDGTQWIRTVLDQGGMAGSGCAVADLNGDGRLDIACIGASTANLKWYENIQP